MNIKCIIIDDEPSSQNVLKSFIDKINYLDVLISRGMNGDIGYYPLVIEYSKLNFNPTFLENIVSDKYVSFPFLPIIIVF